MKKEELQQAIPAEIKSRREFFKISGLAVAGAGLLLTGCNNDDDGTPSDSQLPGMRNGTFDLGGGDLGILTYAYALEQLEAEFSTRVVTATGFTTAFNAEEQQMMLDIYNHEVIHRATLRNLLNELLPDPSTQLLPDLQFNFGNLNFSDRNAVLQMANTLEETGIAAYNGAGKYITDPENLNLAGKIVSVEGRHASAIRQLLNQDNMDFAPTPLDPARPPSQILTEINNMNLITTDFTAMHLQ
jgi:hypothetical protein